MADSLSPQTEQYICEALAHGQYPSREALLDEAVQALRQVELNREELERALQLGSDDIENGRFGSWDPEDAKRRLRERINDKKASA